MVEEEIKGELGLLTAPTEFIKQIAQREEELKERESYLARTEEEYRRMKADIENLASNIFTPDLFKWIIIANKNYDKRRLVRGYLGMNDLLDVD